MDRQRGAAYHNTSATSSRAATVAMYHNTSATSSRAATVAMYHNTSATSSPGEACGVLTKP
jgi:hypothetical protein